MTSFQFCIGWVRLPERMARLQLRTRWAQRPSGWGWLACAVLAAAAAIPSQTAAQKPSRDDVQAAYLYNFGKFVRWPEGDSRSPILVCVAGQDPSEETIGRLAAGERINGRQLAVRGVERPEEAAACSILFIGAGESEYEDAFLAATAGKPILTVSDAPDFLERGGMIQFLLVEDHVRFSVNLGAANRGGVGLSSELLKVALRVTGGPDNGGAR